MFQFCQITDRYLCAEGWDSGQHEWLNLNMQSKCSKIRNSFTQENFFLWLSSADEALLQLFSLLKRNADFKLAGQPCTWSTQHFNFWSVFWFTRFLCILLSTIFATSLRPLKQIAAFQILVPYIENWQNFSFLKQSFFFHSSSLTFVIILETVIVISQ